MLRVLILSTLFPDASRPNFGIFVERQTRALLARDDIAAEVVAPLGIPPWPLTRLPRYAMLTVLPQHEVWKGLPVYRPRFFNLPATGGRFHARALVDAVTPLLEKIRVDFPFDLIAAEYFFPDGVAAIELGRRFDVPVTIKARGSDIHGWTARPPIRAQIVEAGRSAQALMSVSNAMRDDMIALGMPADRIETVVTGVDLSRFTPRDRAATKAALGVAGPLVVSLGALIPLKGHDIVIDAVERLPGVSLWIAGEGPDRKRLTQIIERRGLGDRIRLLGSLPPDRVATLLAAADVMALASEREGLANAWLEALASGTPIVIPDVGGARQVVRCPEAGRIVGRDPAEFANAISSLLAAPPAPDAVRAVAQPFTWAANSEHLHALFRRLVDARHATPAVHAD